MERFSTFYIRLLEEGVTYKYPNGDGAAPFIMADFYMLNYMKTTDIDLIAQHGSNSSSVRIHNMIDDIDYAEDQMLPRLKEELLNDIFYALSVEFRHIFDATSEGKTNKLGDVDETYNDLEEFYEEVFKLGFTSDSIAMIRAISKYMDKFDLTPSEMVRKMKVGYSKLNWDTNYGGKAWASIASGWLRLNRAKSKEELYVAIDHVYDLQHNTDSVFNKLHKYYIEGGYDWIAEALDLKANMLSFQELVPHLSGSMKKLARPFLQAIGDDGSKGAKQRFESKVKELHKFAETNSIQLSESEGHNDYTFFMDDEDDDIDYRFYRVLYVEDNLDLSIAETVMSTDGKVKPELAVHSKTILDVRDNSISTKLFKGKDSSLIKDIYIPLDQLDFTDYINVDLSKI